jgi:hypothetical protein
VQACVGAEGQPPDRGVEAVGPDDEAEPPRRRVLERDVDAVVVLAQIRHGVAEDVLDACAGGVVQDVREVVAQHLDLGDDPFAVERVDGHAGGDPAAGVHPGDAALVERDRPHPVHHAHPLDDGAARPAQVHGLTSGAHRVGPLHDGDVVPGGAEPVRESRSRDARAGDEDVGHEV